MSANWTETFCNKPRIRFDRAVAFVLVDDESEIYYIYIEWNLLYIIQLINFRTIRLIESGG